LLPLAKAHALDPVWMTCNPANAASVRVMERRGARFVETLPIPSDYPTHADGEREKRRYCLWLA
jgi:tagatose 1,6-diphosphate aldolase